MASSWNLGGLSLYELIRRTIYESWKDEVFGQAGRMAFYHFLAIFPILFASLALLMRMPDVRDPMMHAIRDVSTQVLPGRLMKLMQRVAQEQDQQAHARFPILTVGIGVLWATFNGTWAMIYGLNNAYEVKEDRSFPKLAGTIAGLSLSLTGAATVSVFLIFSTRYIRDLVDIGAVPLHLLEWAILIATLSFSLSILYRYGPSLHDRRWQWSTPGAVCALLLWIAATFGARIYFDHINNYSRSYGHLNGVAMLLLWLYLTNGAILIGGEMNSEIEKAAKEQSDADEKTMSTKKAHSRSR